LKKLTPREDIILICNYFPILDIRGYPTGRKELVVDRAFDSATGKQITVPSVHPSELGAVFDAELGEWVIRNQ
jgi:hypothetical protein